MNEKKQRILETAMNLFSEKGFHNTTIQEIAMKSGVSKGAFYLHFDSKEDLTLNIFKYYHHRMMGHVKSVRNENLDPKDSFAKQIQVLFESFVENKNFIMIHIRNNSLSLGTEIDTFIKHIKHESFQWNKENLVTIYGEQIMPSIVDATSLVDGIINGYMKWFFGDSIHINIERLSKFIVRRIDDCIQGILVEKDAPQLDLQQLVEYFPSYDFSEDNNSLRLNLENIKTEIDRLDIEDKRRKQLHIAIDVMLQEEEKDNPQAVIFKGMLTQFEDIPEVEDECRAILKQLA